MNESTYTDDARWADAIAMFVADSRAHGNAESTIDRRVRHLERFARDIKMSPWHVTREDFWAFLQNLPVERSTMLANRVSLRAFYRWALRSRRIFEDPTEEPSQRARRLEAPAAWEPHLRAWKVAMRATGSTEASVRVRVAQMSRFARDNASLEPWQVSLEDILEWFGSKRWAVESLRAHRSAIRSFYRWAKSTKRTKKNPAKGIPPMRTADAFARPADDHSYRLALAKAEPRERLALRLAAELGMRCGEVCQAHSSDLSGASGAWELVVHGKGRRRRALPVSDDLAGAIRIRGEGFLFPGQYEGHLSPGYLSKRLSELLPDGVTMHMLRHRFATIAYNVDRDVFTVQQLLGHASPATTQRYVRVQGDALRRTVAAVSAGALG